MDRRTMKECDMTLLMESGASLSPRPPPSIHQRPIERLCQAVEKYRLEAQQQISTRPINGRNWDVTYLQHSWLLYQLVSTKRIVFCQQTKITISPTDTAELKRIKLPPYIVASRSSVSSWYSPPTAPALLLSCWRWWPCTWSWWGGEGEPQSHSMLTNVTHRSQSH